MFWGKTAQQLTDIERALLAQEVQYLKTQEETVCAETVAPEKESGWTRFVAGFKEGWNEEVAVEDYEDQTVHNNLCEPPQNYRRADGLDQAALSNPSFWR